MATAAIINLNASNPDGDATIELGSTYKITLQITLPNGDSDDLTDFTTGAGGDLRCEFRETKDSSTYIWRLGDAAAFPNTSVVIEAPSTAGKITITISEPDTEAARVQTPTVLAGVYDIEGVRADTSVRRIAEGAWAASKDVTQEAQA